MLINFGLNYFLIHIFYFRINSLEVNSNELQNIWKSPMKTERSHNDKIVQIELNDEIHTELHQSIE